MRAAEHQLSSAEYTLESLKRDIEKDVRNSWQKFVTLDATADILQNQADISAAFLDLARKERRLGTRSLLDVLAGETTYINSVSNAVSAKIAKKSAAFELLYAVGILDMNRF